MCFPIGSCWEVSEFAPVVGASANARNLQESLERSSGLPQAQGIALKFKLSSLPTLLWQNGVTSSVSARPVGPSKCMMMTGKVVTHDYSFNYSHDQLSLFGNLPLKKKHFPCMILVSLLPEDLTIKNKAGQPALPLPLSYSHNSSSSLTKLSKGPYLNSVVYSLPDALNFPRPGSLRDQIIHSSQ